MKTLHQSLKCPLVGEVRDKETSNQTNEVSKSREQHPDMTAAVNNPKIDTRLLSEFHRLTEEYERLTAPLKDVARVTQGADYNIAHPFARKDMPTDAYHLGKSMSEVKKT